MKRLVVITVGKTHSGKTTFARKLEQELKNSIVMDQDNHGAFINKYYKNLQPKTGPNTLKHAISQLIVDYAKEHNDCHLIICNSNRSRSGRTYLLEQLFPEHEFIRILVHFDLPDHVLHARVLNSQRSTDIFRSASNFEQVLDRQNADSLKEDVVDPVEGEADHLFVIKNSEEVEHVIDRILMIDELEIGNDTRSIVPK
ncbi:ATP-binding protein [Sporosarcina sp. ACRSL]|uniref:ATP-binding protein n=1 Tax=Sporosarcina sp. ACRSL TaxID=2918215 RepID=UPI001EF667F4|nr:ATP-binding protein [Sporosarcina sp. ACRSL]MCG7345701.1 ATP-binding protein [Sporosarcina sp. ACRSL]